MMAVQHVEGRRSLRRVLGFWGTASLSIGVMAPTLAMSITGSGPAGLVGAAAPLAFAFAAVVVLIVSSGFVLLARTFNHAGSVYAFVGLSVGPRAGFFTGWALLGTYLVFPWVSVSGIAVFLQAFLKTTGLAPELDWYPLALAGWVLIWVLASRGIRPTTRWLLIFEGVAVLIIIGLMAVIFAKLASGMAPRGQGFSTEVLRLPRGVDFTTLTLAATFGFLPLPDSNRPARWGKSRPHHGDPSPARCWPRSLSAACFMCYV